MSAAPTRRTLLAGAGIAVTSAVLSTATARGQTPPAQRPERLVLRARPAQVPLRGAGAPPTAVWGFEGAVPGPLLRVRRGEPVAVRLANELGEATAIHWHGVRLANAMDGAIPLTQGPVAPAATFDYRFTPPDAGTFWYRAASWGQALRGLCGPLIVDETQVPDLDRDVVLTFNTWSAGPDTKPRANAPAPSVFATANGATTTDIPVRTNERLRLRLINAAAGLLAVRLERHRASVVAIDGQPAEPYEARNGRVVLAPGNRIDLVVDADLPAGAVANLFVDAGTGEVAIARCVYAEGPPARPAPRSASLRLPPNALPERMDFTGALKRDLSTGDDARAAAPWLETLDVRSGPQPAPVFAAKRGRTVTLGIANRSAVPQMIHPHGHAVRLLDRLDDGWKPFWLDTVLVMPGTTERIAFVADNPGQWALDCVSVEAKPSQRLAWFAVE